MTLDQLITRLRTTLEKLGPKDINELADYLPVEHLSGLEVRLKVNLLQLCNDLSLKNE